MQPVDTAPTLRRAQREFLDALLTLSDDPDPENVDRYLEASKALDEARRLDGAAQPTKL